MAINVNQGGADVKAALKTALDAAYGGGEAKYDEFAGILADNIAELVLQHIKDNADVVGVTSGADTVVGGVD